MKILFLNHNIVWTGGFFRAYHWGRHLVKRGHSTTIMTISENNKLKFTINEKDGVKIVKTPDLLKGSMRTGWDIWDTIARSIFLSRQRFDIIHCVDTRPNVVFPGLFLRAKNGGKLVMDWGDWWGRGGTIKERNGGFLEKIFEPIETFFEENFRKYADGNVVLSNVLKKRALSLGISSDSLITIPHGSDTFNIIPRSKKNSRVKLKFDQNKKIMGYLGAIFQSDAELLVSSFRKVKKQIPDAILLIIGNCKADFPVELLNNKSIIKTGKLDFAIMLDYISVCDIMLLPLKNTIANRGRWPSKVCDYLAVGKPVVATKVGDICQLFENKQAGFLSNDNVESFSKNIIQALGLENLELNEKSARKIAIEQLDWKILTKKLEKFYTKILNNKTNQ